MTIRATRILLFLVLIISARLCATEWAYLETEAFQSRYATAAFLLRDCTEIVEIGGYKTPISGWTAPHQFVTVIDPLTPPHTKGLAKHLPISFQDWDKNLQAPENFGLLILGMDLQGFSENDWNTLYTLIDRAQRVVIGFPTSWKPSKKQFQKILEHTGKKIALQMQFDFSNNDFSQLKNSWPPRTIRALYVLD